MKLRIAVNRITWGMVRATTAISLALSWAVSIPAQSALAAPSAAHTCGRAAARRYRDALSEWTGTLHRAGRATEGDIDETGTCRLRDGLATDGDENVYEVDDRPA